MSKGGELRKHWDLKAAERKFRNLCRRQSFKRGKTSVGCCPVFSPIIAGDLACHMESDDDHILDMRGNIIYHKYPTSSKEAIHFDTRENCYAFFTEITGETKFDDYDSIIRLAGEESKLRHIEERAFWKKTWKKPISIETMRIFNQRFLITFIYDTPERKDWYGYFTRDGKLILSNLSDSNDSALYGDGIYAHFIFEKKDFDKIKLKVTHFRRKDYFDDHSTEQNLGRLNKILVA